MNKSIDRRLDRLTERLLPDRPGRCWQIVIWTSEGPVKGPVLTWRPGPNKGNTVNLAFI
jgi:hypothetical protein